MSPFFRGSVSTAKRYPRAWSLNPRLNPDLPKDGSGAQRISIFGLPSYDTGTNLPVFNGVYAKPSPPRADDEAVVVVVGNNNDGDVLLVDEKAQVHGVVEVAQDDVAEVVGVTGAASHGAFARVRGSAEAERTGEREKPLHEAARGRTPPEPVKLAFPSRRATADFSLSEVREELLEAESPIVNDCVDQGSPGNDSPVSPKERSPTAVTYVGAGGAVLVAGAAVAAHGGEDESQSREVEDGTAEPLASPDLSQENVLAEPLPSISEEAEEDEGPAHDLGQVQSAAGDLEDSSSGPAGLGPLPVITEEAATEDAAVLAREESESNEGRSLGDEASPSRGDVGGGLTPVHETPGFIEEPVAGDHNSAADGIGSQEEDALMNDGTVTGGPNSADQTPEFTRERNASEPIVANDQEPLADDFVRNKEESPDEESVDSALTTPKSVDDKPDFPDEHSASSERLTAIGYEEPAVKDADAQQDEALPSESNTVSVVESEDRTSALVQQTEGPVGASQGLSEAAVIGGPVADDTNARGEQEEEKQQADSGDLTPVDHAASAPNFAREARQRNDSDATEVPDATDTPFETPLETPTNRRSLVTDDDSTPFETSFETQTQNPFWATGSTAQAEPKHHVEDDDDEPAQAPSILRHSSAPKGVARTGVPDDHGEFDEHVASGVSGGGGASFAESAADVEPLIADGQLELEFKPGPVEAHPLRSSRQESDSWPL